MDNALLVDRRIFFSALLFALMIGSSGCGTSPAEPPPTPSATALPPSPSPAPPPTETRVPTPSPTLFVPKATIKIASQGPLSGEFAAAGTGLMRGAELAVVQLAGPLQELGYKTELAAYDDQNDVGAAVATAKDIVADSEILCGVGPYTSRMFVQVQEIYHQAGLAFVAPSTTASYVTTRGYIEVNRIVGREDNQGAAAAQFVKGQGFSSVFIVSDNNDYAQFVASHFRNDAARMGVQVVGNMKTDTTSGFEWLVDRVMTTDPDLVFFAGWRVDQAGTFFREARAAGFLGTFLASGSLDTPALVEFGGPLLADGGGTYYTTLVASPAAIPEAAGFVVDFETFTGEAPGPASALAYDAAGVCMRAVYEASEAKAGELPTRQEVAAGIRALQDYRGITGVFNFNENGDPDPARYFVFKVSSVDPGDWSENTLVASYDLAPPQ